ncbi:SGNH/GDSL hydrolase family protein [Actinomycetes bacterium KLBMP 9759]
MTRVAAGRWAAVASVPVAALVVLAAPAHALPAQVDYVALGDSYAAGPLIPLPKGSPAGCLRSTNNYASVVARERGFTSFTDVTCSAATTEHLTAPQQVTPGTAPPQFDALTAETDLVTMTMGGNDIGFGSIVTECALRSPTKPQGAACKDHYTAGGTDQLEENIQAAAAKIATAINGIAERSPDAEILIVGYPAILPDTGPGCFPVVPFSPGDVAYLRDTEKKLNAMLDEQAGANGATYVDTYTPSIGHDVCQLPTVKWVEGLIPTEPAAPVHPNQRGERGMADAVLAALSDSSAA